MADEFYAGIDVGATSVKIGIVDKDGNIFAKANVPTPPLIDEAGYTAVTDGVKSVLESANIDASLFKGIGLAVPCPIPADGNIAVIANLNLNLLGLYHALQTAFPNAYVGFLNDANAAAMGELWKGAGTGYNSLVFITIGTGIGAGIVYDGKVLAGANGAAGELGHVIVNPAETRQCGCGRCGCLEQYASATGIVNSYRMECEKRGCKPVELSGPSDSRSVFKALVTGDEAARAAIDTMAETLGFGLANAACSFDPEVFVLGGGVSAGAEHYLDHVTKVFKKMTLSCCANTPITVASLGNDAGMLGAAYYAVTNA